jgi:hypothetical protein
MRNHTAGVKQKKKKNGGDRKGGEYPSAFPKRVFALDRACRHAGLLKIMKARS